jgi:hypothetical protein
VKTPISAHHLTPLKLADMICEVMGDDVVRRAAVVGGLVRGEESGSVGLAVAAVEDVVRTGGGEGKDSDSGSGWGGGSGGGSSSGGGSDGGSSSDGGSGKEGFWQRVRRLEEEDSSRQQQQRRYWVLAGAAGVTAVVAAVVVRRHVNAGR